MSKVIVTVAPAGGMASKAQNANLASPGEAREIRGLAASEAVAA